MLGGLGEILLEISFCVLGSIRLSFYVLIDGFSLCFLRFVLLISFVVMFYRFFYMRGDTTETRFIVLVVLFVLSMCILILSPSLLRLIVGWDGLGITSFLLVIYYNNIASLRSGLVTIYINRIGDIFIVLSMYYLFYWGWIGNEVYLLGISIWFSVLILLAGITKSAQMPFSSWLPAAIIAPTPVSSLVHSSTLVTAGVYIFIRFFYLMNWFLLRGPFLIVSVLTSFSAGIIACVEEDIKKLVAISTLRQLGLIMFSLSLGNLVYCFFHIVSHALFKALLFLSCGFCIMRSLGLQDIRFIGQKFSLNKGLTLMLFLANLSLCGFPFLSGFFSKDMIIEHSISWDVVLLVWGLFLSSCILSVAYRIRVSYFGMLKFQLSSPRVLKVGGVLFICPIVSLYFWSISLGKYVGKVLLDGEIYLYSNAEKLLGVGFLLIGLLLFWGTKFYFTFFVEILYINFYWGYFISKNLNKFSYFIVGESYWLEYYGAKGLYRALSSLVYWFIYLKASFKYSILFGVLVFMLVFILLFSLFKVLFWRNKEGW